MMDALERLRREMAAAASVPSPQWEEPTLAILRQNTATLEKWIKTGSGGSAPTRDAVAEAIQAFCARQGFASFKVARYACYGCADPIGRDQYRLIEDERCFPRLLECVDEYRRDPRRFRRCFRGLLRGYVIYDPEGDAARPSGKKNWRLLRTYLNERAGQIRVPKSTEPEWVDSVCRNRELLTERAGEELGRKALDGDRSHFEAVCKELEVSDQSWVVRNFILAQLDAAASKNDRQYRQTLPRLHELLEQHPLFISDGLARLLERYRKCTPPELDANLRDFSVKHWGNPWLKLNDRRWGRVSEATRQMVGGWLKLKFMEKFFGLLAEDGINDARRLNFWLRYIDHIGDMYFALGKSAMHNNTPDFRLLRTEMTGRVFQLYASGTPTNNAFIMRIGTHVVVEFGAKGNACFVFDGQHKLPFGLTGYVAGDATELKHESHVARLLHIDRSESDWEDHFERELARLLRVTPAPATRTARRPAQPANSTVGSPKEAFNQQAFDQLVRAHRLSVADNRRLRGALWVHVGNAESPVTAQLRRWGFKYNEHKTAWWRA